MHNFTDLLLKSDFTCEAICCNLNGKCKFKFEFSSIIFALKNCKVVKISIGKIFLRRLVLFDLFNYKAKNYPQIGERLTML